ncbi:MAG: hypothetical protein RDU89_10320 [bacterium]|nr:hypothetical protein [bacterium]
MRESVHSRDGESVAVAAQAGHIKGSSLSPGRGPEAAHGSKRRQVLNLPEFPLEVTE